MFHSPVGKFLAVSGEFGPGKEPSLGQADCKIMPRAKHPGQFEELPPAGELITPECGPRRGMQLHPPNGPIYRSKNRGPGRRSNWPKVTQWDWNPAGHQVILELVMIFEAGQCPVLAEVHVEMDSLYSHRFVPNQSQRMWLSPCSFALPLGSQAQSQGPGQPELEGAGNTPRSLALSSLARL